MATMKPLVQAKAYGGEMILGRRSVDARLPMAAMPARRGRPRSAVSASACTSPSALVSIGDRKNRSAMEVSSDNAKVTPEKLDHWIQHSIGEIVSNIGEAPFLVHIYSNGPLLELEREEALPEKWPSIKKRWDQGTSTRPDGIILVEELKDEDGPVDEVITRGTTEGEASKTWGLVVQGKGMDCASCYILNTCRVRSTMGFCTHFCLLKAKCFGDPFETGQEILVAIAIAGAIKGI